MKRAKQIAQHVLTPCGMLQERARLEAWRNSVRGKYEKSSYNTDIPAALPRQLTVSQRVTARHPVTRQLHDGDILTIAPDCYRCAARSGVGG